MEEETKQYYNFLEREGNSLYPSDEKEGKPMTKFCKLPFEFHNEMSISGVPALKIIFLKSCF